MASDVTLTDLTARTLDYADMTGSTFPVSARVTDYINDGLTHLHDILVNSGGEYFLTTTNINVLAGTETYSLPADFYKARKVFYTSSNRRYKVEKFNLDEIDGYKTSPIASGTVELWYIPEITRLAAGGDKVSASMPLPDGWEDFIALHAAIRLLVREETDTSLLNAERQKCEARIIQMASPRDLGQEEVIGDYYERWSYARQLLTSDERHYKYRIHGEKIHFIELELLGL